MKYVSKIAIVTLSLIMVTLSLIAAPAAMAEENFHAGDWIMLPPGEAVYGDVYLQQALTATSDYILVKLTSVAENVAAIQVGDRTVFVSLQYASHLQDGDQLVTNCKTYVFKEASIESQSQVVPAKQVVEFIAIFDDCAKVLLNGVEGYMYIKHLNFVSNSRHFTAKVSTGLN